MRGINVVLMGACACALVVRPVRAQVTADSTTDFRAGEWGVGFIQGRGLTEGGVLRFTTPTRAWVLDGWATFDQQVYPGAGLFGADVSSQATSINASIGPRWYHAQNKTLVRFAGVGIEGSYMHTHSSASSSINTIWLAGAYGELGMLYMFTRHFGLGWRGSLVVARTAGHESQNNGFGGPPTQKTTLYRVDLQPVQVMGTIYF